jgi:hypothetical protein
MLRNRPKFVTLEVYTVANQTTARRPQSAEPRRVYPQLVGFVLRWCIVHK